MDEKNKLKRRRRMDLAGSALTVGGALTVSGGIGMLLPAAGVICLGLGLLGLGLLICRKAGGMRDDR